MFLECFDSFIELKNIYGKRGCCFLFLKVVVNACIGRILVV